MPFKSCVFLGIVSIFTFGRCVEHNKVYWDTSLSNWKDAMKTCLREGGTPLSHAEFGNNSNIHLKENQTVWTADFAVVSHHRNATVQDANYEDSSDTSDCMYATIDTTIENSNITYFTSTGVLFDSCSSQRGYICEVRHAYPKIVLLPTNWTRSKEACISANMTLMLPGNRSQGFAFITGSKTSLGEHTVWLDHTRVLKRNVNNRTNQGSIDQTDIVRYGAFNQQDGFTWVYDHHHGNLTTKCAFDNHKKMDDLGSFTPLYKKAWFIPCVIVVLVMLVAVGITLHCLYLKRQRMNVNLKKANTSPQRRRVTSTLSVIYANGHEINVATNNAYCHIRNPSEYEQRSIEHAQLSAASPDNFYCHARNPSEDDIRHIEHAQSSASNPDNFYCHARNPSEYDIPSIGHAQLPATSPENSYDISSTHNVTQTVKRGNNNKTYVTSDNSNDSVYYANGTMESTTRTDREPLHIYDRANFQQGEPCYDSSESSRWNRNLGFTKVSN